LLNSFLIRIIFWLAILFEGISLVLMLYNMLTCVRKNDVAKMLKSPRERRQMSHAEKVDEKVKIEDLVEERLQLGK